MSDANIRTSQFFDAYARDFNAIYNTRNTLVNRLINRLLRKSMKLRYEKTLQGCHPIEGKKVIDVGCGPGHYGIALARRGAAQVLGIDFAQGMIDIAKKNAELAGVMDRCRFVYGDFLKLAVDETFDYAIVMGLMDYIREPELVIQKVLRITGGKAFFSFPADGGFWAWQRKLRYKRRCDLFLFTEERLRQLFAQLTDKPVTYERISRDYFVAVDLG